MKQVTWHGVAQFILTVTQVINVSALPAKYQPLVAGAIGLIQMALHQFALAQEPAK